MESFEIVSKESGQYIVFSFENGQKQQYKLKDFPYPGGGPRITGKWNVKRIINKD